MRLFAVCLAVWFAVSSVTYVGLELVTGGSEYSEAERFALRVDAVLDEMEPPKDFWPESLDPYWLFEVAPYFSYEGLTEINYYPPTLTFEPQLEAVNHNHILGYTYCEDEVFINIRVINTQSAWYGWERNPLATLVHEMVHTLKGDFCAPDSALAESSTQTGTLEVLAALANGGNKIALYSLLLELKDMAMDVALYEALEAKDLDGYRDFRRVVDPSALEEARFEKSMRFWSQDMSFLKEILAKYSVLVFENSKKGKISIDLGGNVSWETKVLKLDDLTYAIENLEAMASDAGSDES